MTADGGGIRPGVNDFNSHARVGRDGALYGAKVQTYNFNSHARVGRDLRCGDCGGAMIAISTHTPV